MFKEGDKVQLLEGIKHYIEIFKYPVGTICTIVHIFNSLNVMVEAPHWRHTGKNVFATIKAGDFELVTGAAEEKEKPVEDHTGMIQSFDGKWVWF